MTAQGHEFEVMVAESEPEMVICGRCGHQWTCRARDGLGMTTIRGSAPMTPTPARPWRAQADLIRTEQKEAGGCPTCGSPERFARRMVGYHFPHAEPCKDGWH